MAKPRVFLGTVAVVPRSDFKRHFEDLDWRWWSRAEETPSDGGLQELLREIFALPTTDSAGSVQESDLALDVFVAGHSAGGIIDLSDVFLPLIWRPRLDLRARLYALSSGETVETFSVTERPRLREFLSRFGILFGYGRLFGEREMEVLMNRASLKLLEKIAAVAYK